MNQEEGLFLSNTDVKNLTILRELPFVVKFQERVKILQRLILQDKKEIQGDVVFGDADGNITVIEFKVCVRGTLGADSALISDHSTINCLRSQFKS